MMFLKCILEKSIFLNGFKNAFKNGNFFPKGFELF
jgi:hypothetical protein